MPRIAEREQMAECVVIKAAFELLLLELEEDEEIAEFLDTEDEDAIEEYREECEDDIILELGLLLHHLETQRYFQTRRIGIKKPTQGPMYYALHEWKFHHPSTFRSQLRVSPEVFDTLVAILEVHPVFQNQSNHEQIPVQEQVAIALYRLGHDGNACSMTDVGLWSGKGHGTVDLVMRRVLTAMTSETFRAMTLYPPTEAEKEHSRQWVEEITCPLWRGGWCGVDGSCIPLFGRPAHFGNTWYDRKGRYSTNVQVSEQTNS
jgi:hypothetical protein